METEVANLRPSPLRDYDDFPIDRKKVDALKVKIQKLGFMGSFDVEEVGDGTYEIISGHHRLTALEELLEEFGEPDKVNVLVKKLPKDQKIQAMIDENLSIWQHGTAFIISSMRLARDFLDSELSRCKDWEDSPEFLRVLFPTEHALKQAKEKKDGVGQPTIEKYLEKSFSKAEIQHSLAILKHEHIIDLNAVREFAKLSHAHAFFRVLKDNPGLPKEDQKPLAKEVIHALRGKLTIDTVKEKATEKNKKKLKEYDIEPEPNEGEDGINRDDLLSILKLLKNALAKKGVVESMQYYYFNEDRIIACSDWVWASILFDVGFTGLLNAVDLDNVLSIIPDNSVEFTPSQNRKKLGITGKGRDAELDFIIDEEYCQTIKARIPKDGEWHEIPGGLFDALEFCGKFASTDFGAIPYASIQVQDNRVFSQEIREGAVAIYQLEDKVVHPFAMPKFQMTWTKTYFRETDKRALKMYKVEPLEKMEGAGFTELIHFQGDEITVSYKSRGSYEIADTFETDFKDEADSIELPKEIINVLSSYDKILAKKYEFEDDRLLDIQFEDGKIRFGIGEKDVSRVISDFDVGHGLGEHKIEVRLGQLKNVMNHNRDLIHIDYERKMMEFGNEFFRLAVPLVDWE
jgi:hypothetical protein